MQAVPAAAGFRIKKSKLEIVVTQEPVKGPPCFVAPAAVPGYAVGFQTGGNRAAGFNGLLIEAGLFTALMIKALRSDRHEVAVRLATLRFHKPIQRNETGGNHTIVRASRTREQHGLGQSRVAIG